MQGRHAKKHANKVGMMHESKAQHIGNPYIFFTLATVSACYMKPLKLRSELEQTASSMLAVSNLVAF